MIGLWREQLQHVYQKYLHWRSRSRWFIPKLFFFFVMLNLGCYWLALITAFPSLVFGSAMPHYAKIQFPVGLLGALFDSLSFFVTLHLVRGALASHGGTRFLAHLSVDLVIAFVATWWVLFVFVVSGWMVNVIDGRTYERNDEGRWQVISVQNLPGDISEAQIRSEHWEQRTDLYSARLVDAVRNPTGNLKNIYFGVIMGISAMLPTCVHLWMFLNALLRKVLG